MYESRRSLLRGMAGAVGIFSMAAFAVRGQDPFPKAPTPMRPGEDEPPANPNAKSPAKVRLEENQKDIKKDIEKLFDLASQLKQQVEKTDATAVLSLAMVKKAEEIERLARQIKERAKG
jgi:peptidoglycan hydrolase CwlO-like protein